MNVDKTQALFGFHQFFHYCSFSVQDPIQGTLLHLFVMFP